MAGIEHDAWKISRGFGQYSGSHPTLVEPAARTDGIELLQGRAGGEASSMDGVAP